MSTQGYNTAQPRIGKLKGEILKHAVPVLCLGISGDQKKMGRNQSDTVIYRRWLPRGGSVGTAASINRWDADPNAHLVQEGVTPEADTIAPQDITVQLKQYACLYSYTDKTAILYEDKIPDEMKTQAGERMGLVREMIDYGALKSCTNRFYAGGSTRPAVDEAISLRLLRAVTRSIKANRGKLRTQMLDASPNYNTAPVEQGVLVFAHSDAESDVRDLPGFINAAEYSNKKFVHPNEIGAVESFRFVLSPELAPITGSGAAVGSTGLLATGGNVDVYPFIVVAQDFWANVALRGFDSFDPIHIPYDQKDKNDPLGQRGYIGSKFWSAAFIQNDGWGAVIECGVSEL